MSSFNARSLALAAALALGACGFTPVYGPGSDSADLLGAVSLGEPDSPQAFDLVRALELRLGPADTPRFNLEVDVDLRERGSVITRRSEIERFTITANASYALTTLDGDGRAQGTLSAFTSYSASGSPMATRAARDDAQLRLMEILADQMTLRLAAALL